MDWKNNKLLWIIGGLVVFNLALFGTSEIIVRRTTAKVIERLQKEYSPSPYGPGLDPDKVNPDALRPQKTTQAPAEPHPLPERVEPVRKWGDEWERLRGAPDE